MRAGQPLEHGSRLPEITMLTASRSFTCELSGPFPIDPCLMTTDCNLAATVKNTLTWQCHIQEAQNANEGSLTESASSILQAPGDQEVDSEGL